MKIKDEIIRLSQLEDIEFSSKFLSNKPYKYSNKEELRWLFWLTEIQQWLRDKHKHHIFIQRVIGNRGTDMESESWTFEGTPWSTYPTYEEALESGIYEALKLIEKRLLL